MLREEKMVFNDVNKLRFVFLGCGVWALLGRISKKGANPMRGIIEAIWKSWV